MKKLFFLLPFLFAFISCDLVTDKEYFVSVNPNHSFSWFNGSAVCYNFNCDVIQYYVENSVQLKKNGIACEIEFEWVTSSFVKIRPKEEWFNGALYLCELKGILYEKSGEEFSVNDAVAFYYGNAAESFCLTQAPFDEQRFDLNKAIVFKFNHKVYKTKFLECLSISTSTSYRVEANDDDTEFTIIPNESWRVNEIINWSFNDLISADNYILSGKNSGRIRCISDIEKPKVLTVCAVSSKDADAFWDTENSLNNNISGKMPIGLIFSKSMNLKSLKSGFSITPNISGNVLCVSDDCTKFLFVPEENYAIDTEYLLNISSDVEDTLGIKISETYKEIFDMMTRMLGDSLYAGTLSGIIEGDRNLQLDLIARKFGDDVFNDYVDNCYDSSADYWRMTWGGQIISDGDGWLKDMNGEFILDENGNKIGADKQESGLLNIMAGTGGQKYDSFTDEQKLRAQDIMKEAGLSMDSNGQWYNVSGKEVNMTAFMDAAGPTVSKEVFNAYYNNTVDSQIGKLLGVDLGFDTGKTIPKNQYGNYISLLGSRIADYFSTGNAKQTLTDKYFQTITNENGESTTLYKLDKNNPFLDKLRKQTDEGLNSTINKSGCNFMATIAFPQLLTGNILETNEIQSIWDYGRTQNAYSWKDKSIMPWITNVSEVKQPDFIANETLKRIGYSNLQMTFGGEHSYDYIGMKIRVPYHPDHFLLGDIYGSALYNPANTIGRHTREDNVYVHFK